MQYEHLVGHGGSQLADEGSTHDLPLVERCLPALAVLERHGVTYISLVMQFECGGEVETYAHYPRFYDHIRIPRKSREEVVVAWANVSMAIEDAIRKVISGTDYEDADFLVSVSMRCSARPDGWSVENSEITAMLDVLDPSKVIELP